MIFNNQNTHICKGYLILYKITRSHVCISKKKKNIKIFHSQLRII